MPFGISASMAGTTTRRPPCSSDSMRTYKGWVWELSLRLRDERPWDKATHMGHMMPVRNSLRVIPMYVHVFFPHFYGGSQLTQLWRLVFWHPNINCIVSGMVIQCYSTNFKRQVCNVLNFALRTVAAWRVSAAAESGRSPVRIPSGITKTFHKSLNKTAIVQSCLDTPKPMVYHHLTLANHLNLHYPSSHGNFTITRDWNKNMNILFINHTSEIIQHLTMSEFISWRSHLFL